MILYYILIFTIFGFIGSLLSYFTYSFHYILELILPLIIVLIFDTCYIIYNPLSIYLILILYLVSINIFLFNYTLIVNYLDEKYETKKEEKPNKIGFKNE